MQFAAEFSHSLQLLSQGMHLKLIVSLKVSGRQSSLHYLFAE